jgi:hypothetical protein
MEGVSNRGGDSYGVDLSKKDELLVPAAEDILYLDGSGEVQYIISPHAVMHHG